MTLHIRKSGLTGTCTVCSPAERDKLQMMGSFSNFSTY
jgi:hypothetical protein